jgi:hypothetical protein
MRLPLPGASRCRPADASRKQSLCVSEVARQSLPASSSTPWAFCPHARKPLALSPLTASAAQRSQAPSAVLSLKLPVAQM